MSSLQGSVEGVVLLSRHGDRTKFYQDPNSYTGYETHITALGEVQTYGTGQFIRSRYIDPASDHQITGISVDTINLDQCTVTADAAAEANVIVISAYSMWQGIYPATPYSNVTLADGTTVISPLSGQQYLPIQTVEFAQSPLLEAFTSCPAYTSNLARFYNSSSYALKAAQEKSFLTTLPAYVDGRSTGLKDMYNVFDYINVNSIYNGTYSKSLGNSTLRQASDVANWLSYSSFTGATNSSAGNIAGRGLMGSIIPAMQTIANASTDNKIQHFSLSYKPFLSLFNMTGAASTDTELQGIVSYASLLSFELRNVSNAIYVNMVFRNGTDSNATAKAYPILGRDQIKMTDFVSAFNASSLYTTLDWCRACNQTTSINNCDALLLEANSTARALASGASPVPSSTVSQKTSDDHFSAVGAGFIGAVFGIAAASIGWFFLYRKQENRHRGRGTVSISSPVQMDDFADRRNDSKNPFRG